MALRRPSEACMALGAVEAPARAGVPCPVRFVRSASPASWLGFALRLRIEIFA